MNIYLDMDDVVADWQGHVEKMLDHKYTQKDALNFINDWGKV